MTEKAKELRIRLRKIVMEERIRPEKHVLIIGKSDEEAFDELIGEFMPCLFKGFEVYFDDGPTRPGLRWFKDFVPFPKYHAGGEGATPELLDKLREAHANTEFKPPLPKEVGPMDFSDALRFMKTEMGFKVARKGWNGKDMWILMVHPSNYEGPKLPEYKLHSYIRMKTADNYLVPWLASQTDLLAEDWYVVK